MKQVKYELEFLCDNNRLSIAGFLGCLLPRKNICRNSNVAACRDVITPFSLCSAVVGKCVLVLLRVLERFFPVGGDGVAAAACSWRASGRHGRVKQ